jgi:hypothetical protein
VYPRFLISRRFAFTGPVFASRASLPFPRHVRRWQPRGLGGRSHLLDERVVLPRLGGVNVVVHATLRHVQRLVVRVNHPPAQCHHVERSGGVEWPPSPALVTLAVSEWSWSWSWRGLCGTNESSPSAVMQLEQPSVYI